MQRYFANFDHITRYDIKIHFNEHNARENSYV